MSCSCSCLTVCLKGDSDEGVIATLFPSMPLSFCPSCCVPICCSDKPNTMRLHRLLLTAKWPDAVEAWIPGYKFLSPTTTAMQLSPLHPPFPPLPLCCPRMLLSFCPIPSSFLHVVVILLLLCLIFLSCYC